MNFRTAFTRQAKRQSEQVTLPKMHWRHKENGWEVVSTVLCSKWDNAVHPDEHDDFNTGTAGDTDITRYTPESPGDWETFHTQETRKPMVLDQEAFRQFETAFHQSIDYMNAEEAAEFLHDTFEAEYHFDDPTNTCSACDGTGTVCDADDCLTYCTDDCGSDDEALHVSDDQCSCTSCNYESHWVECDECNGAGETRRETFTRTFPYTRDKILSEMPSKRELQVLQFILNQMGNAAAENDTTVSFRKVLSLFSTVENNDEEALVQKAVSYLEPSFDTVEVPEKDADGSIVTDETGKPVMQEQPNPEEVTQTKVKLTATLNDMSEQQAEQQVA